MQVELLYFGILRERCGRDRETIELPAPACISDLLARVSHRPGLADAKLFRSLAVALNQEYAQLSSTLKHGDEVALLPPVSGGFHAD